MRDGDRGSISAIRCPTDVRARTDARFNEAFEAELQPIDGIEEALDAIPARTCVASSSEPDRLRYKLGLTGLYERFAGRIFSATEVRNGKPAPDLFLHAARRWASTRPACAVVEDSQYGVQAARAAGMDGVRLRRQRDPGADARGPGHDGVRRHARPAAAAAKPVASAPMAEPSFRFVCVPDALAGAPSGWARGDAPGRRDRAAGRRRRPGGGQRRRPRPRAGQRPGGARRGLRRSARSRR